MPFCFLLNKAIKYKAKNQISLKVNKILFRFDGERCNAVLNKHLSRITNNNI